ncbi:MAG: MOSC domain-containing protein [Bacteroidota bacterium]
MKLVSVNVGKPQTVNWKGKEVETGIYKESVDGVVKVNSLNLEGDQQADLKVHGGVSKAVYAYPSEHYEYWKSVYPEKNLDWGKFGENLTTSGVLETEINVGDQYKIGSAIFEVTEPRMPCYKLGIKMEDDSILKKFLEANYSGFYFKVVQQGELQAGDSIELVQRDDYGFTVSEMSSLYWNEKKNKPLLEKALGFPKLLDSWKPFFEDKLKELS